MSAKAAPLSALLVRPSSFVSYIDGQSQRTSMSELSVNITFQKNNPGRMKEIVVEPVEPTNDSTARISARLVI